MILPRRLMKLEDGRFCEEHDPRQAMNFRPKGFPIPDAEAEKIGLKAYLDATGWGEVADEPSTAETPAAEQKAVAQAATEDKAVAQASSEDKSAEHPVPPEDAPAPPEDEAPAEPGPGLHVETEGRPRRRQERPS